MHRTASRLLVQDRYRAVHGAEPAVDYPAYLTIGSPEAPHAVLGYRNGDSGPLFLEAYLGEPVEAALTRTLGRPVPRGRIVELGDHASHRPGATLALWREAATALEGQADIAVAVLTRPLRAMFAKLSLDLSVLAPACREALGDAGAKWGRYYDADPLVCAGEIAVCRVALDRALVRERKA